MCEETCGNQRKLSSQDFGMSLTADDLLSPFMFPSPSWLSGHYLRPWQYLQSNDLGSTIQTDKDKFQINLDVQHFSPEEVTVKVADGYVTVEGKHDEKKDEHGFVSRQFVRKYVLPEGTIPESVTSELSADGILTIVAPRKDVPKSEERVVPITQTGPVRKTKENVESQQSCDADSRM
ncbi:Protein lethal(2)essential for life [Eumeta japonica]|uniref:Protein lethal(2)essential for life n=1 Tax=Eumeta variegata TaxID=151549 RepID=A0A4C1UQK4_EUMVA|nr:Protein lethal(2)essential for life [Eumeta japonica]